MTLGNMVARVRAVCPRRDVVVGCIDIILGLAAAGMVLYGGIDAHYHRAPFENFTKTLSASP